MIRNALVAETRDANGLSDGGLMLLSTVPSEWFAEGKVIELKDFPTAIGIISVTIRSEIRTKRTVTVEHSFTPHGSADVPRRFVIRIAPPHAEPKDIEFDPAVSGTIRVSF